MPSRCFRSGRLLFHRYRDHWNHLGRGTGKWITQADWNTPDKQNPRKTVPRAIKRVFYRLLFFYVFGIFFISVLVPYTEPLLLSGSGTATASPFVIAIQNAGIKGLPSVINAVILISAWSAGNSDIYASSRTLYALALEGQMPRFVKKCTKKGLPIVAVAITSAFCALAYLDTGGETAVTAFGWLYNISAVTGILTWWTILLSYLRFYYGLKKQGLTRDSFPYIAPLQPYLSWYGVSFSHSAIGQCSVLIYSSSSSP